MPSETKTLSDPSIPLLPKIKASSSTVLLESKTPIAISSAETGQSTSGLIRIMRVQNIANKIVSFLPDEIDINSELLKRKTGAKRGYDILLVMLRPHTDESGEELNALHDAWNTRTRDRWKAFSKTNNNIPILFQKHQRIGQDYFNQYTILGNKGKGNWEFTKLPEEIAKRIFNQQYHAKPPAVIKDLAYGVAILKYDHSNADIRSLYNRIGSAHVEHVEYLSLKMVSKELYGKIIHPPYKIRWAAKNYNNTLFTTHKVLKTVCCLDVCPGCGACEENTFFPKPISSPHLHLRPHDVCCNTTCYCMVSVCTMIFPCTLREGVSGTLSYTLAILACCGGFCAGTIKDTYYPDPPREENELAPLTPSQARALNSEAPKQQVMR